MIKPLGDYNDQFVKAENVPTSYKPVSNGQCVSFIQAHGYKKYKGNALEWAKYINSDVPTIGGVVVLKESKYGHLGLITGVVGDNIYLIEQNYLGTYIVSTRTIKVDYDKIVGFIR